MISARTDIGLRQITNQDRYGVRILSDGTVLMALADGFGGEPGGEIASHLIMESLQDSAFFSGKTRQADLVDFFYRMDGKIAAMAEETEILSGMATTLTLVAIKDRHVFWAHSGDSRLYHFRSPELAQISHDQTLARFLMDEGELSPDDAGTHYSRNVPDLCIGCRELKPETGEIRLESGDMVLLLSDGVYRSMDKKIMNEVIKKAGACVRASDHLIEFSLLAGGRDNMTAVVAKIH